MRFKKNNGYVEAQYKKVIISNKIRDIIISLIKKAAIGITAIIAFISYSGLTAYADYDPCDVNHDNSVTMADAIYIAYYLNGNLYCPNYNQLDANRDLSVDVKDKECVQAKILQLSYSSYYYSKSSGSTCPSPIVSGFSPDGASTNTNPRYYWKHYYTTNITTSYYLTPSSNSMLVSSTNTTGVEVNDIDSMQISQGIENTGIVRIGGSEGTGFIIGKHEIATAAHCVYDFQNTSYYSITLQTYNSNGTLTGNMLTPKECHIPYDYTLIQQDAYDYAVITVSEDLSSYFKFDLGTTYNMSELDFSSIPIYVTGCPNLLTNSNHILYTDEGHIVDNPNLPTIIFINSDTASGQSGSPIYTISKQMIGNNETWHYTAVGILRGMANLDSNCGSRITKYHLQFYKNNPNLSY